MQTEIVISGFGGQGTLFAGSVLSYMALDADLEVTWIPSYGPEMRGGTANCTVIISDEVIGSPLVKSPQVVIAMNLPSVEKYEPLLKSGGIMVVNSSLTDKAPEREDIQVVMIPANDMADELGNLRLANMICMGALTEVLPLLDINKIKQSLADHLPERQQKLVPINHEALDRGSAYVKENLAEIA